jgi:hypothetical protein
MDLDVLADAEARLRALSEYVRINKAKLLELQNLGEARLIVIEKGGAVLKAMPKHPGTRGQLKGRDSSGGPKLGPPEKVLTFAELGFTGGAPHRWQRVHKLGEPKIEEYSDEARAEGVEVTLAGLLKFGWVFPEGAPVEFGEGGSAKIVLADAIRWLQAQKPCDLLITDPPYSTDIEDIEVFAASWLPLALSKVKLTGRAFICIGAYPREVKAYLDVSLPTQILIWSYKNTFGPCPQETFFQNYQMILYYKGTKAGPLIGNEVLERFSAFEINAPDARVEKHYHRWEKPLDLGKRLIGLAPGQLVLDPFAGTGTFLLAAANLNRTARGCDSDPQMVAIAKGRGCGN